MLGTVDEASKHIEASSGVSQTVSSSRVYIKQALLLILEDIASSTVKDSPEQVFLFHWDSILFSIMQLHLVST